MKINKNVKRKSSAQAMVEFAIALPVLLLLLYGLLETGRYLFLYSTVVNASRQAVRYGSATGIGNNGVPRYQDCLGIRNAAHAGAYVAAFENIEIDYDAGPGTTSYNAPPPYSSSDYCSGRDTDNRLTGTILSDNAHRLTVTITEPYTPLVPKLVPFVARDIVASSSRTILLSVSIEVTAPSVLGGSSPTASSTSTETPSATVTPSHTATATFTNTPITHTPTPSFTPSRTPSPTATFTPSNTPTPTYTFTPSFTPTPSKTPISNCNTVSHGPETIEGRTFSMTINNPTGVDLQLSDLLIWWNHDGGNSSGSLRLQSITLESSSGTTTVWEGNVYSVNFRLIPDEPLLIPTGQSTIVFTFHKNYQYLDESEQIFINFETNGCQNWPIDSNL